MVVHLRLENGTLIVFKAQILVIPDMEEEPTLAVEFDESLLVLGQLSPARHLVDLSLQDGDLTVPPSLERVNEWFSSQRRLFQIPKAHWIFLSLQMNRTLNLSSKVFHCFHTHLTYHTIVVHEMLICWSTPENINKTNWSQTIWYWKNRESQQFKIVLCRLLLLIFC